MNNYDYEKLRRDLINYLEGGFFVGGFGGMIFEIERVNKASNEELLIIAQKYGFNINDYIINIMIKD